nr:putative RNA-directed DNA polymerase, eukaryota, reverse transcriptase zinc-binding domain protein [Tanacetum cinerariifolium]
MNALGQMFGFCRFIKVSNQANLVTSLSNIWIGKMRLFANIARFDRKLSGKPLHDRAQVVKPTHDRPKVTPKVDMVSSYANAARGSSQCDSKTASVNVGVPSITLSQDKPNDFPLALVGCYKDFRAIPNTRIMCCNEGFSDVDFKYLGGLWILFDFQSPDVRDKFLHHNGFSTWISTLKPWYDEFVVDERLIWLEVEGVPIRAWDNSVFSQICKKELCSWTPTFVGHDYDKHTDGEQSVGNYNKNEEEYLEANDIESVAGTMVDAEIEDFTNDQELGDKVHVRDSPHHNEKPIDSDPFELDHLINKSGVWIHENVQVQWIVVYAPQALSCKISLWSTLSNLLANWNGISVVMGDFNEVREESERHGSIFFGRQARLFNDFITNNSLIDIPLGGYNFTWTNKWGTKMSKLDRFLVSESFYETFSHATGLVLVKGIPDHRPILIKESVVDYGPTPFRFFHSWLEMDGFHDLVVQTWSNDGITDGISFILFKKKLQNLKKFIRVWNASRKADTYALKKGHQNLLSLIDSKIDQMCASEEDYMKRRESLAILGNMDSLEAKDYAQKAKIKWALEGDENTSFFHGSLKKKRRQLAIRGILKHGEWIETPDSVEEEFLVHFRNRFKQPVGLSFTLDSLSFSYLSQVHRDYLELPFSCDRIKRSVWDCSGDHAPGPDGFTFRFFTTFWDTIAEDVVRFMQDFSISHEIPKGCNPSFIALIPKIPNSKFVTDFRPISLIGCQYKIIGKLLANRLSSVIGDCISHVQSAFIKGRYILDGPLILNEILTESRHHHKKLLVLKVDFEKAFDSLRWDFLDKVMEKIGFGTKWRSWISGCLRNVRSSILVNGSPTKEFKIFKGLRQGDPLSHFLFILAMEGLHSLTCKAEDLGLFKGLKINVDKSKIFGVGVSNVETSLMARTIGYGVAKLPFKYLGVPVGCNMNPGGHLSLIKAVLGNLPTYFMSVYLMPVFIRAKLESMRSKFFRGPLALWSRIIRSIYGQSGGVYNELSHRPKHSTWASIVSSVHRLKEKGGYSVDSARTFVDDTMLETDFMATRWNR